MCKESNEMQMNNFEFEYKRRRLTEAVAVAVATVVTVAAAAAQEKLSEHFCANCQLPVHKINVSDMHSSREAFKLHSKFIQFFVSFFSSLHLFANNNIETNEIPSTKTHEGIRKIKMRSSATACTVHTNTHTRQVQLTLYFRFTDVVFAVHK